LDLTSNEVEAVPIGIGNCTGLKKLLLERNWQLVMPPKDVVAKGYPATWEFLRKMSHAERSQVKIHFVPSLGFRV